MPAHHSVTERGTPSNKPQTARQQYTHTTERSLENWLSSSYSWYLAYPLEGGFYEAMWRQLYETKPAHWGGALRCCCISDTCIHWPSTKECFTWLGSAQPHITRAAFTCCHLNFCLLSPYQGTVLKNNRTVARDIAYFAQKIHLTKFEVKTLWN